MSYAVQCIQEVVVSAKGYASEIKACESLNRYDEYVFTAFSDLMRKGFISREYYEDKGHKVLAKFAKNTNAIELDLEIKNDEYNEAYVLVFKNVIYDENNNRYVIDCFRQVFVGSKEGAKRQAKKLKTILAKDPYYPKVIYRIKKLK